MKIVGQSEKRCCRLDHDHDTVVSYFHGNVCNVCHANEVRRRRNDAKKKFKTAKEWFEYASHKHSNQGTIGFCRNPRESEFENKEEFENAIHLTKERYKEYRKQKRKPQEYQDREIQETQKIQEAPRVSLSSEHEDTNEQPRNAEKPTKKLSSKKTKYENADQWYDNVVNKTSSDGKTLGNCRRPQSHEFLDPLEYSKAQKLRHNHQLKYRAARRFLKQGKEVLEKFHEEKQEEKHKTQNTPAKQKKKLTDTFLVMPFSLLEASSNAWQIRKKHWNSMFDSLKGRNNNLLNMSSSCLNKWSGTSRFDPVLCEVIYSWYCPRPQLIKDRPVIVLDPFAGGCVRGIVASKMGLQYIGIDTNEKQVNENIENYNSMEEKGKYTPIWIHGDSMEIEHHFKNALNQLNISCDTQADLIFTCPPYFNLEVYTNEENDLSNMKTYQEFLEKYEIILNKCSSLLSNHHLCVFVVSNFRDKKGEQIPFHIDTQSILLKSLKLHQDIVLSREKAQAAYRARMITSAGSKLANTHQNICIFSKKAFTPKDARMNGIRASEEEIGLSNTI